MPPSTTLRVAIPVDRSGTFEQALNEVVKKFNSKSSFKVQILQRGSSFQSLRAIIASSYAGDLPELAIVNEADIGILSNLNLLQAFPDQWITARKFLPIVTTNTSQTTKVTSIPFQRQVPVWYFNREILFKANQPTDTIPLAWEKLSALSKDLHHQFKEVWGLALPATGEAALQRWSALGIPFTTADAISEWVATTLWPHSANWLPGSPTAEESSRRFLDQQAAILLGSIDQWTYIKKNARFKIGAALPAGELAWFGTDFVQLAKDAASAKRAMAFLDYLYRPETFSVLSKAAATLPLTQAAPSENPDCPLVKLASQRKLKPLGLSRIGPELREEWANLIWQSVDQPPGPPKAAQLKSALQKLLSTNPR
jgi:hypothetical protein